MVRTFFFTVFALLVAAVFAVPTEKERRQFSPADIINALGIGLVADIHAFITVRKGCLNPVQRTYSRPLA